MKLIVDKDESIKSGCVVYLKSNNRGGTLPSPRPIERAIVYTPIDLFGGEEINYDPQTGYVLNIKRDGLIVWEEKLLTTDS